MTSRWPIAEVIPKNNIVSMNVMELMDIIIIAEAENFKEDKI